MSERKVYYVRPELETNYYLEEYEDPRVWQAPTELTEEEYRNWEHVEGLFVEWQYRLGVKVREELKRRGLTRGAGP